MKEDLKKLLLVFFLLLIYIYVIAIQSIPEQLVVFEGENIKIRNILGINVRVESGGGETIETVSNNKTKSKKSGQAVLKLSLFNNIDVKNVNVDVLPKTKVIPLGSVVGIKLYTNGVLVVGMSEIEGIDNKKYKPYEKTGIKEGDMITEINNEPINSTEELITTVNNAQGKPLKVKYQQEEQTKECSIEPVKTRTNEYKIGLWVRDSAARSRNSNFL